MTGRVLVTGGQGFIGKHLVYLLEKNPNLRVEVCDREDPDGQVDVENLTDSYLDGIDVIVHCAASVSVTDSVKNPDMYFHNNVVKLASLIKKADRDTKFVFLSTGSVYGEQVLAKEHMASIERCSSPYAMSKLVGEKVVERYMVDHLILRLANVYGEGQDQRGESNVYTHFSHDNPIVVFGGDQTRDFVDVRVVVDAILRGIDQGNQGVFNIGSGKQTKIATLAIDNSKERGVPIVHKDYRPGEVLHSSLDISKALAAGLIVDN